MVRMECLVLSIRRLLSQWIMRATAVIFSMVLILFFVLVTTKLSSVSIMVIWFMSFMFWSIYSGRELLIMIRVIFLYVYHRIVNVSYVDTYDEEDILDSLITFNRLKISLWDGHVIPFLIYLVFSSMVFGLITTSIYVIVAMGILLYLVHTILRLICIRIIQYTH